MGHAPRRACSALDALTRADVQQHLLELWAVDRQTLLVVTHGIDEVLLLADTIVVLGGSSGRVVDRLDVPARRPRRIGDPTLLSIRERVLECLSAPA